MIYTQIVIAETCLSESVACNIKSRCYTWRPVTLAGHYWPTPQWPQRKVWFDFGVLPPMDTLYDIQLMLREICSGRMTKRSK